MLLIIAIHLATINLGTQPAIYPADKLLKQVQNGVSNPISISPSLSKKLIFFRQNTPDPAAACDAIAAAVQASIVKTKDGFRIERTADDLNKIHANIRQQRKKWLLRTVQDYANFREKQLQGKSQAQAYNDLIRSDQVNLQLVAQGKADPVQFQASSLLPSQSLLLNLVNRIGIDYIAGIPSGSVVVFEDQANAYIQALPDYKDLLESYAKENSKFISLAGLNPRSGDKPTEFTITLGPHSSGLHPVGEKISAALPQRLRLQVTTNENGINAFLEGYDAAGNRILSAGINANAAKVMHGGGSLLAKANLNSTAKWYPLSDSSFKAWQFASGEGSRTFPEWFKNPNKVEPLNSFVSEALNAISDDRQEQDVAYAVSDCLWPSIRQSTIGGRLCLTAVEEALKEWTPYECVTSGTFSVWRPLDPEIDERMTVDRTELQIFLKTFDENGGATVRNICLLYAKGCPQLAGYIGEEDPLCGGWPLRASMARGIRPVVCNIPDSIYRVLGSITDSDWSELTTGKTKTVGELGLQQQTLAFLQSIKRIAAPGIYSHPIDDLGDSPVDVIRISMKNNQIPVVESWGKEGEHVGGWTDMSSLKSLIWLSSKNYSWKGGNVTLITTQSQYEDTLANLRFRLGAMDGADVTLMMPNGIAITAEFRGKVVAQDQVLAYKDFPQELRNQLWKDGCERGLAQEMEVHQRLLDQIAQSRSQKSQPTNPASGGGTGTNPS